MSNIQEKKYSSNQSEAFEEVEDGEDLSILNDLAAQGTKKAFEEAKKISKEMVMLENGKILIKKKGEPDVILAEIKERSVEKGSKISL